MTSWVHPKEVIDCRLQHIGFKSEFRMLNRKVIRKKSGCVCPKRVFKFLVCRHWHTGFINELGMPERNVFKQEGLVGSTPKK